MTRLADLADQLVRVSSAAVFALCGACAFSQAMTLWRGMTTHYAVTVSTSFTPEPFGDGG